jgi:phage/plasmid-like protein (TIGR03299 family)
MHEVETMMYAREVPWHGIGVKVEQEVTAAAAIKLGGLDWDCEKQPIFLGGTNEVDGIKVVGHEIVNKHAVVRKSDGSVFGVVSDAYEIIQNSDCFDFMDTIIGEGQAVYHTAGSLFGGRIVFMTVKLPDSAQVGPDKIDKYILLSTSHDGSSSLSIRWTPVRVVCANTLEFAERDCSQTMNIRHRSNYRGKIEEAREVLELTNQYYQHMEESFNKMLDTQFSEGRMVGLAKDLFPIASDQSKRSTQTAGKIVKLTELFTNGAGHKEVAGTQWAAYNAVTEFVDHHATYRAREGVDAGENKMNSVFFGGGHDLKQRAFNLLTQTV